MTGNYRKGVAHFAAALVPFAIQLVAFWIVADRALDIMPSDPLPVWFGKGASWLTKPLPILGYQAIHQMYFHPAVPHFQVSAAYLALTGLPAGDMRGLATFGIGYHLALATGLAAWTAACAVRAGGISPLSTLAIAAASASVPGYTSLWTIYPLIAAMVPALTMGLALTLSDYEERRPYVLALMVGLGFATTVSYLATLWIATLGLAALCSLRPGSGGLGAGPAILAPLSARRPSAILTLVVFGLALLFALGAAMQVGAWVGRLGAGLGGSKPQFFVAVAVASLGLVWLALRLHRSYADAALFRVACFGPGLMLIGWGAGMNVLILGNWHSNLPIGFHPAASGYLVSRLWDIVAFRTWTLLIPVICAAAAVSAVRLIGGGAWRTPRRRFTAIFAVALCALTLHVTAFILGQEITADVYPNEGNLHYLIMLLPAGGLMLVLAGWSRLQVLAAVAALLVGADGIRVETSRVAEAAAAAARANSVLEPVVAAFLARHPGGEVVCLSNYLPRQCAVRLGYNERLLSDDLPLPAKVDARIRRIRAADGSPHADGFVPRTDDKRPTMIVVEGDTFPAVLAAGETVASVTTPLTIRAVELR
jgi:hypothetical protein